MQKALWRGLEYGLVGFLLVIAAAGWWYLIYNQNKAKDPIEIVKKHFIFYPEFSHGIWREGACLNSGCKRVTYTIPVQGCGPVTFDWRVFPGEDADSTSWTYNGPSPKFDESEYPLYAVLSEDSRLIDSPALGRPLPQTCQRK